MPAESPELAAAREREQAAYEHWQSLHQQLQTLTIPIDVEAEAYAAYELAAVERSRLERGDEEPRRFSCKPTEVGDFWRDADLDVLTRDAAATSSPLVKHILITNIEAERERRGENPPLCEACLDGVTLGPKFHQLVGHVCDPHFQECRQIEAGPKEHIYQGIRAIDVLNDTQVLVDDQPLPMTELARKKSPSGFEWGYGGSGPAALAHALLAYEFGAEAEQISYQDFKWAVIATLEHSGWTLTSSQIRAAVAQLRLPTIEEAAQEPVDDFTAGFTEEITVVTRSKPDPMS